MAIAEMKPQKTTETSKEYKEVEQERRNRAIEYFEQQNQAFEDFKTALGLNKDINSQTKADGSSPEAH